MVGISRCVVKQQPHYDQKGINSGAILPHIGVFAPSPQSIMMKVVRLVEIHR
jgi:hypothetical protein